MLNNLKSRLTRFMYGRYGVDHLYIASGILFLVLQVLQLFGRSFLLNILSLALIIWSFYRALSRNIAARQAENRKFLKWARYMKAKWDLWIRKAKDIRTHRYRTCTQCRTILRFPRKRGTHAATCPKCGKNMQIKIRI